MRECLEISNSREPGLLCFFKFNAHALVPIKLKNILIWSKLLPNYHPQRVYVGMLMAQVEEVTHSDSLLLVAGLIVIFS